MCDNKTVPYTQCKVYSYGFGTGCGGDSILLFIFAALYALSGPASVMKRVMDSHYLWVKQIMS